MFWFDISGGFGCGAFVFGCVGWDISCGGAGGFSEMKVVSLTGDEISPGEVNAKAVEVAEELLARARSGDVVGISAVMLHSDRGTSYFHGGCVGGYSMLGAVEMLRAELVAVNSDG